MWTEVAAFHGPGAGKLSTQSLVSVAALAGLHGSVGACFSDTALVGK